MTTRLDKTFDGSVSSARLLAALSLAVVVALPITAQDNMGPDVETASQTLAPQVAGSREPSVTVIERQGLSPVVIRSSARFGVHDPLQIRNLGDGLYGFTRDDGPITGVPRVVVRSSPYNDDFRRIRGDDRPARFRNRAVLTIDRTSRPYEDTVEPRYRFARTVTAASMLPEGTRGQAADQARTALPASVLRPTPESDAAWDDLEAGKPLVALDAFIALCAIAPDDPRARLGYALSAEASGQRGRAEWAMTRALALDASVAEDLPESIEELAKAILERLERIEAASSTPTQVSDSAVVRETEAAIPAAEQVSEQEADQAAEDTIETLK